MTNRKSNNSYKRRAWPMYLLLITVVAALAMFLFNPLGLGQAESYESLPEPAVTSEEVAGKLNKSPEDPSAATPSASVKTSPALKTPSTNEQVKPGRVTQIYLPADSKEYTISTSVLPLDDCRQGILPPESGDGFGAAYGCTDYAQPGTDESLAVLAGHSSNYVDTAFNALYEQGEKLVGRNVYIKTTESGPRWLVYRIDKVMSPLKEDLPYLPEVWGAPGESTTNRMVLVTCDQDELGVKSTRNTVVLAQLVGVK